MLLLSWRMTKHCKNVIKYSKLTYIVYIYIYIYIICITNLYMFYIWMMHVLCAYMYIHGFVNPLHTAYDVTTSISFAHKMVYKGYLKQHFPNLVEHFLPTRKHRIDRSRNWPQRSCNGVGFANWKLKPFKELIPCQFIIQLLMAHPPQCHTLPGNKDKYGLWWLWTLQHGLRGGGIQGYP